MNLPAETADEVVVLDRSPSGTEEFDFFSSEEERAKRLRNDSDLQDMKERIRYANNAYGITQAWVGFLIVITISQFSLKPLNMGLGTTEFVTVITTTTVSILGFWLLVGQYLFHRPKPPPS